MGTQKITMGRGRDSDYNSKKAAALAQADSMNDYMWGAQSVYAAGIGPASKASRSRKYGNTNLVTGDALDGVSGNFRPKQDPAGNSLLSDPVNQTGYLDGQYSATSQPQADPEIAGQMAFDRIQQVAMGGQWGGHNNRQQVYGA
jgi:hypothetical protein